MSRTKVSFGLSLTVILAVLFAAGVLWSQDENFMDTYTGADADKIGDEKCLMCHKDQAPGEEETHITIIEGDFACESCHGPGANHNGKVEGILAFSQMPVEAVTDACVACHEESGKFKLDDWTEGAHYAAGTSCCDCHSGHASHDFYLMADTETETCTGCHAELSEAFTAGDHGGGASTSGMTCANCHNPHK